jgi:small subunit ribosomal protein S2e
LVPLSIRPFRHLLTASPQYAGIEDAFTSASGKTATMGNFIKATFGALKITYGYLTPDLWKKNAIPRHPFSEFSQVFENTKKGATASLK